MVYSASRAGSGIGIYLWPLLLLVTRSIHRVSRSFGDAPYGAHTSASLLAGLRCGDICLSCEPWGYFWPIGYPCQRIHVVLPLCVYHGVWGVTKTPRITGVARLTCEHDKWLIRPLSVPLSITTSPVTNPAIIISQVTKQGQFGPLPTY